MCLNSGPFFNKFPLRGCGGRVAALFQLPPAGSPRLLMPFGIRAASLATRWLSCVAVQVAQACTPRGGESLRLHRLLFLTHLLGSSVPSGGCFICWVLPSLPVAVLFFKLIVTEAQSVALSPCPIYEANLVAAPV